MKQMSAILMNIVKFFSFEVEGFDILNSTEVIRRRNIIVNRVLMITNILVTVITLTYPESIPFYQTLSVLIPTLGINFLISYFVNNKSDDQEKQLLGMYVAVLSVSYLALRLYLLYPATYTYLFLYFALGIIALFQNRHAMMIGSVLIFGIASFFHINEMMVVSDNVELFSIIGSHETALRDTTILTLFLLLFIFVLTSMVIFSEYMDRERKQELQKRSDLEREFNEVLFSVFDTIEDFSKVGEDEELSGEYAVAIMAKKLAIMHGMSEQEADHVFQFAVSIGVNYDFSLDYDDHQKENLLKDYATIKYKLHTGSALLRRMRLKIKTESMVRSRYESNWFISDNFKKFKGEDSSIENQLVMICETYLLLRDKQNYKKSLAHAKTVKELSDNFTHLFDDRVIAVFFENHVEFEVIYEKVRQPKV
jgi:hypothetical protein